MKRITLFSKFDDHFESAAKRRSLRKPRETEFTASTISHAGFLCGESPHPFGRDNQVPEKGFQWRRMFSDERDATSFFQGEFHPAAFPRRKSHLGLVTEVTLRLSASFQCSARRLLS